MTQLAPDELTEYALELLPAARRREIDVLVAASPELQRELRALHETLGGFCGALPQATPSPGARAALLAALDSGRRFAPFLDDLARHLDLAKARVLELLDEIANPARWEPGPMPGMRLMHIEHGPNAVAADAGFVWMTRGSQFPYHRHLGHEVAYVLEGAVRVGDDALYVPGEAIISAPGTAHEYSVPDGADLLMLVVHEGLEIVKKPR
jgi:quercetin dioxygenase-like cupin family protein